MLKNLKSLFVKDDQKEGKGKAEENDMADNLSTVQDDTVDKSTVDDSVEFVESPSPKAHKLEQMTPPVDTKQKSVDTSGEVSDKFMDILLGAMKKNNREGFDYMEYKQSLQSLKKMEMDEATRFQSAFAMAQTMGATKENIANSAAYYLDILKQEKQKFQGVVANQNEKQVVSKQTGAEDILKAIQNKEKQIEKLHADIEALKKDHAAANEQIASSKTKVEKTKNDFLVTYNLLESQIEKDVALIKKYLQ